MFRGAKKRTFRFGKKNVSFPKVETFRFADYKEAQEKYDKVIEEIKEQIELITDAESANNFIAQIDNFEHVGSSKQMAAKLVANKAKSLNLKLNSEKKYEPAA